MTLILGYCYSSYTEWEIVFFDMQYLGGYFLQLLQFSCLCLFLAFLIKRSAFALGFMILLFIVEGILVRPCPLFMVRSSLSVRIERHLRRVGR